MRATNLQTATAVMTQLAIREMDGRMYVCMYVWVVFNREM